jgi:hypothetical protein
MYDAVRNAFSSCIYGRSVTKSVALGAVPVCDSLSILGKGSAEGGINRRWNVGVASMFLDGQFNSK